MTTRRGRRATYEARLAASTQARAERIALAVIAERGRHGEVPRRRRFRRSVSSAARFLGWWWMIPFSGLLSLMPITRLAALGPEGTIKACALVVVIGVAAASLTGLTWAAIAMPRQLARERAWLEALPFDVREYEDCLGDRASDNDDHVTLVLGFEDATPTPAQLAPFFIDGDDGEWTVADDAHVTIKPGPCGYDDGHNQRFVRWFHRVVDERLAPLHARFPLVEVQVQSEVWEDVARDTR